MVIFPDLRSLSLSISMKPELMKSAREPGALWPGRGEGILPGTTHGESAPLSLGHVAVAFASHNAATTEGT